MNNIHLISYEYKLGFLISFFISIIILITFKWHKKFSSDYSNGIQKIHEGSVPRIGGIPIFISVLFQSLMLNNNVSEKIFLFLFFVSFSFIAGLAEDITKSIRPRWRLIASFISAFLIFLFFDTRITDTGFIVIDYILNYYFLSIALTILAIATMSHAINIIDGLHGLSLGSAILILITVISISSSEGDLYLYQLSFCFLLAVLGVFIINFPFGKLFLGDGGAYMIGIIIATLVILMPERNPQVSSLASLLIVSYPIYETLRSFIRRVFSKKLHWFNPDDLHLHSVCYDIAVLKFKFKKHSANILSSLVILTLPLLSCCLAILYYDDVEMLFIALLIVIMLFELMIYLGSKLLKK